MPPSVLKEQLLQTGRRLLRWRAEIRLVSGLAAILAILIVFVVSDLLIQFSRPARLTSCIAILAAAAAAVAWLAKAFANRATSQAVAAAVERSFPELDNHLINYVQFADSQDGDPFKKAYLAREIPGWSKLDIKRMKNRRAHRTAWLALTTAMLLLCLPTVFLGRAWAVAMWRVVNPFTEVQPISLTRLVAVEPGDTSALQGAPMIVSCRAEGRAGHKVFVDINPDDGESTTYTLGNLNGSGVESFSHRIPKITANVRYRFRAGDAPFPKWYTVAARPPLAFAQLSLTVRAPDYTSIAPHEWDGLADDIEIPAGAAVLLTAAGNMPLAAVTTTLAGSPPAPLEPTGEEGLSWSGQYTVSEGNAFVVSASNAHGDVVTAEVAYTLIPDRAPAIEILVPQGRPDLAPGMVASIDFAVSDDYGLREVRVERVAPGSKADAPGKPMETWTTEVGTVFTHVWTDTGTEPAVGAIAFRIVARDNRADNPNVARSTTILFNAPKAQDRASARDKHEKEAFSALADLVEKQRENIERTKAYRAILPSTTEEHWKETAGVQKAIRETTKIFLANPAVPLGNLTPTVKRLYMNEMAQVIDRLAAVPTQKAEAKNTWVTQALNMEEKILRQLTFSEVVAEQTKVERRIGELTALLTALIKGQTEVLSQTVEYMKAAAKVGSPLVDRQDDLAADVTDFIEACRRESASVQANDKQLGDLLLELARLSKEGKIREDMLLAAEDLSQNKPVDAMPDEKAALAKLNAIKEKFDAVKTAANEDKQEQMLEALETAKSKIEKIRSLHERAIESMEMIKDQRDVSDKDLDMMEEEYQELLANTKEAMLEIPVDLNLFTELNVANELIEDVFSVFEEVEQAEGSEDAKAEDVDRQAFGKEERQYMLEDMESAAERLDDLEMWLSDKPDAVKATTEAFDKEEMPEAGIALGALPSEAEDIIGELMEQEEEAADEADDGATTHALPDLEMGWDILEGDMSSFAAKGKSGNERPDHKEQDGRSNVGRQGMSAGETAAGSGTINEGDENIEERRTQDPTQAGQVDLDGEADTKATGGGKLASGKADAFGMAGGTRRMDSTEEGSQEGLEALMAKKADQLYAKASLKNIRADSIKEAAHHLRQAADAIAQGQPIEQVRELRHRAAAEMVRGKAELAAGTSGVLETSRSTGLLDDVVQGSPDEAPAKYRDLVAEYYKSLNESL